MKNTAIIEKQKELKNWLYKLQITQREFSERVFNDKNYTQNEKEANTFYEKFKKQLNRSASIEVLESYLEFLYMQDEFIKFGYIKPNFHYEDSFNEKYKKAMKKISQSISQDIKKQENGE